MTARPRALEVILLGGLAIGVGDFLDAMFYFTLVRGIPAAAVWRSVAGGLYGPDSRNMGAKGVVIGLLLHFLIGILIATVYCVLCLLIPALTRHPIIVGIIFGIAAFFVMNYVVIPLSRVPPRPFLLGPFLNGIIGHALLVGIPVALIATWSAKRAGRS